MRHAHLLGLIGRSHFSAQAQAEESEDRRRLDWDRGYTIFTSSAKRKALVFEPAQPREKHDDALWVVSTPRSPVPASLHLLALELKPSLPSLRAPEHPLFTHPPF